MVFPLVGVLVWLAGKLVVVLPGLLSGVAASDLLPPLAMVRRSPTLVQRKMCPSGSGALEVAADQMLWSLR